MFATMIPVAGAVLMVLAAVTIFLKTQISTGQVLMFAFGAALIAVPALEKFKITGDGVEFTTRDESAELAQTVKDVIRQQEDLARTVVNLTGELQQQSALAQTLKQELAKARPDSELALERFTGTDYTLPQLKLDSQDLIGKSSDTLRSLDILQNKLQQPAQ